MARTDPLIQRRSEGSANARNRAIGAEVIGSNRLTHFVGDLARRGVPSVRRAQADNSTDAAGQLRKDADIYKPDLDRLDDVVVADTPAYHFTGVGDTTIRSDIDVFGLRNPGSRHRGLGAHGDRHAQSGRDHRSSWRCSPSRAEPARRGARRGRAGARGRAAHCWHGAETVWLREPDAGSRLCAGPPPAPPGRSARHIRPPETDSADCRATWRRRCSVCLT
jgi:hypothetical protein